MLLVFDCYGDLIFGELVEVLSVMGCDCFDDVDGMDFVIVDKIKLCYVFLFF